MIGHPAPSLTGSGMPNHYIGDLLPTIAMSGLRRIHFSLISGELEVEGVDLVVADVAHEQGRAIRGRARPGPKWPVVAR